MVHRPDSVALASVTKTARSNEILEGGRMNPRRQPAPLGGERSVVGSPPSAGEKGDRGHSILSILAVAWAYVTSLDRALPVLLCALFLARATTGAWGADGQQERP